MFSISSAVTLLPHMPMTLILLVMLDFLGNIVLPLYLILEHGVSLSFPEFEVF